MIDTTVGFSLRAHRRWLFLFVSLVAIATPAQASDPPMVRAALETVLADDLLRHVEVLADDTFEGRDAGAPGGHAAAKYLAMFFEKHGLEPAGDGQSYLQVFGQDFRNILGVWPGSDPELADEYIVIGAHFDHVGYGNRDNSYGPYGVVHNGADDNASGTSAILELIEALAEAELHPRRSILFCLWDAEEDGLLGSIHWLNHPTKPLDAVRFSINLDMIGKLREERLTVYGERTASGLRTMLSDHNVDRMKLVFDWELAADSDHHPFIEKSIPTVMFHTGLHDTYHRPTDDIETLDYPGIERVTRYVGQVLWTLADETTVYEFRDAAWQEGEEFRKAFETPAPAGPARLGLALVPGALEKKADELGEPSELSSSKKRSSLSATVLEVAAVEPGSPAAVAGVEAGMKIVAIDGQSLESAEMFWDLVHEAAQPIVLSLDGPADSQVQKLTVELAGSPSRVGVSWRWDDGPGKLALITRVGPLTRADRAGLQVGDRIHRIGGEPIESSDEIREHLVTGSGEVELEVEREGILRRCRIELP